MRRYAELVEPGARWRWLVLIGLAVLVSVLEAASAFFVYFLLAAITAVDRVLVFPVVGDLRERFPGQRDQTLFVFVAAFLALFFLVRGLVVITQSYLQYRVVNSTGARLSTRLLRGYLNAPYKWHLNRNSAELIRTAHDSVIQVVANVFIPAVLVASDALVVLAVFILLVVKAPLPTLLAIAVLGPIVFGLLRVLQPRMVSAGQTNEAMAEQSLQALQHSLGAIRDIKILGHQESFVAGLAAARSRQARALGLRATLYDVPRAVVETLAILFILAFLAVTRQDAGGDEQGLAVLGLFAYAVLRVMPALHRIVTHVNLLKFGAPAASNVLGHLEEQARFPRPTLAPSRPLAVRQEIRLAGVGHRYDDAAEDVLFDIDLTIPAGQSVGIIGPTGGGKTTLLDIVLGLLEPVRGTVSVDGVDIRTCLEEWQAALGVVSQSPFLLDDTLRRNIAFGIDDVDIDEEALAEAVRQAQLGDYVSSLPDGLDSRVGERGARISGGQRQRVAIARALYRRPSVLVFDEGTSALDSATEADLVRALDGLRGQRTIITVAHRLTTVRNADQVVLLRQGRIVDSGRFELLAARHAELRELAG